jgi:hypothetical protein
MESEAVKTSKEEQLPESKRIDKTSSLDSMTSDNSSRGLKAETPLQGKRPSRVFQEKEIQREPKSSLNRPMTIKKAVVDAGTEKTMLDSESETENQKTWGGVEQSILVCVSDDNDDLTVTVPTPKKIYSRSKRSPNRDDSDSEDEDGNKIKKSSDSVDSDEPFNPETDSEYNLTGLKTGFAEDRNKRYRRTMEVRYINTGRAYNEF